MVYRKVIEKKSLSFAYRFKIHFCFKPHLQTIKNDDMPNYYCEYCGIRSANRYGLEANFCKIHPEGKGKHKVFVGKDEKNNKPPKVKYKASSI